MWQLTVFSLFLSASANTCVKYTCEEQPKAEDVCAWKSDSDSNVHLSVCAEDKTYCDIPPVVSQDVTCTAYQAPDQDDKLPGESCNRDSECDGESRCVYNLCTGYVVGAFCSSHSQCDLGLYCSDEGRCAVQKDEAAACTEDKECKNNLGCHLDSTTKAGVCTKYYSVETGSVVNTCLSTTVGESTSNFCKTGVCKPDDSTIFDGPGKCAENIVTVGDLPLVCTSDEICKGSDGTTEYTGFCTCGIEEDGKSYCELWSGDEPWVKVREQYISHFASSSVHNCHTESRWDESCFSRTLSSDNAYTLAKNKALVKEYPRLQSTSDCIRTIFHRDYDMITKTQFITPSYSCSDDVKGNTCIKYDFQTNQFQLKECDSKKYGDNACNYAEAIKDPWQEIDCSTTVEVPKSYPGEKCSEASDCLYDVGDDTCTEKVCKGRAQDSYCDVNDPYSCDLGLFCKQINKSTTCQPLLKEGESCNFEWECDYGLGCNFISTDTTTGTCKAYFSVADEAEVTCPLTGEQYLCKSAFCEHVSGNYGKCVEAPKSVKTTPMSCTQDSDCQGKNSSSTYTSKCRAGLNSKGTSYCDLFPGDSEGSKNKKYIQTYIEKSYLSKCQSALRFSENCLEQAANMQYPKSESDALEVVQKISTYKSVALYTKNDDCVKALYTREYWYEEDEDDDDNDDDDDHDDDDDDDDFSIRLVLTTALFLILA